MPLQMLEARVAPGDVAFYASPPALPKPKPQPSELERVRCQLAERDPDRTAAGTVPPKEDAWGEIVSVRPQAANHRSQQFVREMLQRPADSTRQRPAHTNRRRDDDHGTNRNRSLRADAHRFSLPQQVDLIAT
jgi:hypothetical protein